jgi:hypothetical protein
MANIRKRDNKWRVYIRRTGHLSHTKTFIRKEEAIAWGCSIIVSSVCVCGNPGHLLQMPGVNERSSAPDKDFIQVTNALRSSNRKKHVHQHS